MGVFADEAALNCHSELQGTWTDWITCLKTQTRAHLHHRIDLQQHHMVTCPMN